MKHPALTRVMAVVLAVFCLVTLIASGGSLWKTFGDRKEDFRQQQVLRDRTDRAAELSARLDADRELYERAANGLEQKQEDYDRASSDYRTRLATYTATRAGIRMGRQALNQASGAMRKGKQQFEEGYAQFAQGAAAFDQIYQLYASARSSIQRGWSVYNSGLDYLENELGDELEALLTPEEVLAAVDVTKAGINMLKQLLQRAGEQPLTEGDAAESLQQAAELLKRLNTQVGSTDPQALAQRAVREIIGRADAMIAERVAQGASEEEVLAEADAVCQAALGMSYSEAKAWLQENASSVGGQSILGALSEIDPEQAAALLANLDGQGDLLQQALAILEEEEQTLNAQEEALRADPEAMSSTEALLALLRAELAGAQRILGILDPILETAKAQLDAISAQMEQARQALEQGAKAIANGLWQLNKNEADLDRQHDEMTEEKERLLRKQRALEVRHGRVDDYEQNKKEFRAARAALMSYDGVADAVNAGGDLVESAEAELVRMSAEQQRLFAWRVAIAAVLFAACIPAILCVAGAFEKPKMKRLWIPAMLTALLTVVGEAGSVYIGRGLWYSALALLLAALAILPLAVPAKRKP